MKLKNNRLNRKVDRYSHTNADLLGTTSSFSKIDKSVNEFYAEHHELVSKNEMRTKRNSMQIISNIKNNIDEK